MAFESFVNILFDCFILTDSFAFFLFCLMSIETLPTPQNPTLPLAQGRFILYNMFFGENSFCKEGA